MSEVAEPALGQNLGNLENKPSSTRGLPNGTCDKCGKDTHDTEHHGTHGGPRAGGGRKPGGMNYDTKQRLAIRKAFEDRIHLNVDKLLNAAMNKALGETYLMCKVTERDSKGKAIRVYHEIVTDPQTIIDYLDGELPDGDSIHDDEHYYYMSTKPVDMVAVKELYDRAFGKPLQKNELTGKDGERLGMPISADQADQLLKLRAKRAN